MRVSVFLRRLDPVGASRNGTPEIALDATVWVRKTLMAGFTTVRDLGSSDFIDVALRNAVADGTIPGPRMLVAVRGIGATGGHADDLSGYRFNLFGRESGIEDGVADGPVQIRKAVRWVVKNGADVVKVHVTGGVLSLTDDVNTPQLTQKEINALVDEAHALGRKTAAHAHSSEAAKRAIRAGIDSIEHGTFLDDEALDMMKTRGTVLVPTLMGIQGLRERLENAANLPPPIAAKARAAIASMKSMMPRAIAKGVIIGLGTDASVYPHGRNAEEFGQLVEMGMKPIDALKAGTSVNAALLGIAGTTGTLEAGKLADIVAVASDPSVHIRQVEKLFFVMKDGIVYRNDKQFVGLCLLHAETRPSFYVNAAKNLFFCHGCGRGGDLIRFAQLYFDLPSIKPSRASDRNSRLPLPPSPNSSSRR